MSGRPSLCAPSAFPDLMEAYQATGIAELAPIQAVPARWAYDKLMAGVSLPKEATVKPVLIHATNGHPYIGALVRRGSGYRVRLADLSERLPALHRPGYGGKTTVSARLLQPEAAVDRLTEMVQAFRQGEKRSVLVVLGDQFIAELAYHAHLGDLARW